MKIYRAVVVDNNDPSKIGRVKIKILGSHEDTENESTLPWAEVIQPSPGVYQGIGFSSVIRVGSWVYCFKEDDSLEKYIVLGVCAGIPDDNQVPGFDYGSESKGVSDFGQCVAGVEAIKNRASGDETVTSNGTSFQYENTVTASKYTTSSVMRTASGIMMELDDEDERVKVTHPSGTTIEISKDGTLQITSLKDSVLNCKGDVKWNIKGNVEINVDGNLTTKIKGKTDLLLENEVKSIYNNNVKTLIDGDHETISRSNIIYTIGKNLDIWSDSGLISGPNCITKGGVNLDNHVHSGVDRGDSDTDKAIDSV
jgi:hypothetical protein